VPVAVACASVASPAAQTSAPRNVPAALPSVVARVNGQEVMKEDLEFAVWETTSRAWRQIPANSRDAVLRTAMDHLIREMLLSQESEARGFTVDAAEIAGAQQAARTPPDVVTINGKQKSSEELLRGRPALSARYARIMVGAFKVRAAEEQAAPITSDANDMKAFYTQHAAMFNRPDTVRENHIFIGVGTQPGGRAEARRRIDALLKRVKAGEDFDTLARQYSEDGGGARLPISRERLAPALGSAAFAMKPGDVSDVLAAQYGFYILKVLERKPAHVVPFEEAVPEITMRLALERRSRHMDDFLEGLKKKARIEILI
jgi:peptidyl-prolyl cis-trans isomerase C